MKQNQKHHYFEPKTLLCHYAVSGFMQALRRVAMQKLLCFYVWPITLITVVN